jgi:hypothetical protein
MEKLTNYEKLESNLEYWKRLALESDQKNRELDHHIMNLENELAESKKQAQELMTYAKDMYEYLQIMMKGQFNYGPNLEIDPSGADIMADMMPDDFREMAERAQRQFHMRYFETSAKHKLKTN